MYIVSACLLGEPCRYDGNDNLTLGKLSVPRPKSEIKDGAVINEEGEDVTKAFEDGARIAYIRAVAAAMSIGEEIEGAILKSNSPSCGKDKVYDGTFSGTLVDGEGIFAKTLREHGIKIYTREHGIKIYTEKEKF